MSFLINPYVFGGGGDPPFWEELGRTTLGSANSDIAVSSFPERTNLMILNYVFNNYAHFRQELAGTSTNSFVTYVGHHVGGYEQFHYIIENTHGANSLNVKVQFSENGTDFFDAQGYTATAGVTVPPTTLNWNSFSSENTHHFYRVQVQSTSSGNHAGFNIYWNYVSQNN